MILDVRAFDEARAQELESSVRGVGEEDSHGHAHDHEHAHAHENSEKSKSVTGCSLDRNSR